jgi:hypothetical protein
MAVGTEEHQRVHGLLEATLNGLVNVLCVLMCEQPKSQSEAATKDKKVRHANTRRPVQ